MSNLFTEATRVQLTAIQHLARIGYTYLGKISESGAVPVSATSKGASGATPAIPYDPETNILVDIFAEQFTCVFSLKFLKKFARRSSSESALI